MGRTGGICLGVGGEDGGEEGGDGDLNEVDRNVLEEVEYGRVLRKNEIGG